MEKLRIPKHDTWEMPRTKVLLCIWKICDKQKLDAKLCPTAWKVTLQEFYVSLGMQLIERGGKIWRIAKLNRNK